ncbi:unnamed protein product, partial [Polarella glacialis]
VRVRSPAPMPSSCSGRASPRIGSPAPSPSVPTPGLRAMIVAPPQPSMAAAATGRIFTFQVASSLQATPVSRSRAPDGVSSAVALEANMPGWMMSTPRAGFVSSSGTPMPPVPVSFGPPVMGHPTLSPGALSSPRGPSTEVPPASRVLLGKAEEAGAFA